MTEPAIVVRMDEPSTPAEIPATVAQPPAAAPPPPASPDMASLVQMLAAALQQSNSGTAEAIRDGLSAQATMARHPIPETYLSGGYPNQSVYSHPKGGEFDTKLRCPMFLGVSRCVVAPLWCLISSA